MAGMLVRESAAMARLWCGGGVGRVIVCLAVTLGVVRAGVCLSSTRDDPPRPTQLTASSGIPCAWDALAAFAFLHGRDLPAGWLERHVKAFGAPPVNMLELCAEARALGLPVEALTVTSLQLLSLDRPFIAHLNLAEGHFVTVERITPTWARTLDSQGRLAVGSAAAFQQVFSGHILAVWTPGDLYGRDKGAHLDVSPPEHDFGTVVAGQPASFEFDIRNVGRSALDLAVLRPDPDVEAQLSQTTVPPEGSARLRVCLMAHPPTAGSPETRRQTILLSTNDPLRPRAFATFGTRVIPALRVWPKSVYFHRIAQGSPRSRVLQVQCAEGVQLGAITCDNPDVRLSLREDRAGLPLNEDNDYHRTYRLVVGLRPSIQAGAVAGNITIRTKEQRQPLVQIPLTGEVLGPLRVSRPSLFFGFVSSGTNPRLGVDVMSDPPRDFRLTWVELPAFLRAAAETVPGTTGRYHLEVKLDTTRLVGIVKGQVVLQTDLPGARGVRLPYYAHVIAR
jgi:hypothetical protein